MIIISTFFLFTILYKRFNNITQVFTQNFKQQINQYYITLRKIHQ